MCGHWLHLKIFQRHIVHEHCFLVGPKVMLIGFQTTNHVIQLFSWVGHLNWALEKKNYKKLSNAHPTWKTPPIAKLFALLWSSKCFMKFKTFSTNEDEIFLFKSSNGFCYLSPHSKDNYFFKRSKRGFATCKNPLMNF
jgi:hypothetical protein